MPKKKSKKTETITEAPKEETPLVTVVAEGTESSATGIPAITEAPTVVITAEEGSTYTAAPEKEEPKKVKEPEPKPKMETKGDWHPITVYDKDGGRIERFQSMTGWLVRYRNKSGHTASGMVLVEDKDHEWEAEPLGQDTAWQEISPRHDRDSQALWCYPIYKGFFIAATVIKAHAMNYHSVLYERTIE